MIKACVQSKMELSVHSNLRPKQQCVEDKADSEFPSSHTGPNQHVWGTEPTPHKNPTRTVFLHHRQTQPCPGLTQPAPKILTYAHLRKLPWLIALITTGDSAIKQQVDSNPNPSRIQGHSSPRLFCVGMCLHVLSNREPASFWITWGCVEGCFLSLPLETSQFVALRM